MGYQDEIPGGLADKKKPADFDKGQLQKGIKVEMEHTDDKDLAREIAMDHLTEDPEYYTKLETIEKHGDQMADRTAKDLPKTVERYVKEHKDQGMDEDKAWAVAWSRYCEYTNPDSPHCKQKDYFHGKGKSSMARRVAARYLKTAAGPMYAIVTEFRGRDWTVAGPYSDRRSAERAKGNRRDLQVIELKTPKEIENAEFQIAKYEDWRSDAF